MYDNNSTNFHPHASYRNLKRALQSRNLPQNAVIGIILGVIAVVACGLISLLLWYTNRTSRILRRPRGRVDLLGSEGTDSRNTTTPVGYAEKEVLDVRWRDKPLPRIPSPVFVRSNATLRKTDFTQTFSNAAAILRPSSPTSSRPREKLSPGPKNVSQDASPFVDLTHTPIETPIRRLSVKPTHAPPDIPHQQVQAYTNGARSASKNDVGATVRGPLTIVNATENDVSQMPKSNFAPVRGRDAPFPQKMLRPKKCLRIVTPACRNGGNDMSLSVTSSTEQKATAIPSTPTTSYMVQVPIPPSSRVPTSPLLPQRVRSPLTLTVSYPVSSVVIGNAGPVRRPDGSKGKGRTVTMSVLVDESDGSISTGDAMEDPRLSFQDGCRNMNSDDNEDVLGSTLERYNGDLPPYTPTQEV